mmetsp:Transcript_102601/g.293872  ORF Transcript_102601/g.293872 Transcript_102601/m.293872 type:complete len:300 (+) Transcript_102601:421-1320(+)
MWYFFAVKVAPRIPGRYTVVVHNGDQSSPDGANEKDEDGATMRHVIRQHKTSHIMEQEWKKGRLIAHHTGNLWWRPAEDRSTYNATYTRFTRPPFLHCLPIGIENRQWRFGSKPGNYISAMRRFILRENENGVSEASEAPPSSLLLIAFQEKQRVPQRKKALEAVLKAGGGAFTPSNKVISHEAWLEAITTHKFVLAPLGHGLDTHRVSEILMMGGIPVMKRSTISSCYDDSDNELTAVGASGTKHTRGSIPSVIVDDWAEVTPSRLEREWDEISRHPKGHWDWQRLFAQQWLDRIGIA